MKTSRTYLNHRFFAIFAILTFFGVLGLAYSPMFVIGVGGFLGLGWITWVDGRSLVGREDFEVMITHPRSPELGQAVHLRCRVFSSSLRVLGLQGVKLRLPVLKRISFAEDQVELKPEVKEGKVVYDTILEGQTTRLGFEVIPEVTLSAYSHYGLWFRSMDIPIEASGYRVTPTHQDTGRRLFSELVSAQRLIYQGTRYMTRSQAADQFHSIREYRYPDDARHIDHKRTAKFNRLMTRVYDSYHNHHLIMALDLGRSMRGELGGSGRHDYYLSACLALAQNAVANQDHVSFFGFSQKVHYLILKTKVMAPFQPLFEGHSALEPREEASNYDLLNHTIARVGAQRSIVLVFADATRHSIQEGLERNLSSLCRTHMTIVVSLLNEDYTLEKRILGKEGELFRSTLNVETYSQLLYAYWLDDQIRLFRERVVQLGGAVLYIPHKNWLSVIVRLYQLLRESYSI